MSLIEGLGDEVTIAFVLLTLILVAVIAWVSTHTREIPFISVIVVELSRRTELNRLAGTTDSSTVGDALSAPEEENTVTNESASCGDDVTQSSNEKTSSDNVNFANESASCDDVTQSSNENKSSVNVNLANENPSCDHVIKSANQVCDDVTELINESVSGAGLETKVVDEHVFRDGNVESVTVVTDKSNTKTDEQSSHCECDRLHSVQQPKGDDVLCSDATVAGVQTAQPEHNTTDNVTPSQLRHRRLAFFDSSKHSDKPGDTAGDVGVTVGDAARQSPASTENTAVHSTLQSGDQTGDQFNADTHENEIRVRLKYLNDTQRLVYTRPSQTVQEFRRTHFASELANNKLVRFIFNGQDLRNDGFTLQSYNIVDNSVVHCLVTQTQQTPLIVPTEDDLDLGHMMLPLFGFILSIIWYLRFSYRQYFNAMSTLCLVGVTFLFFLGVISSWQGHRRRTHLD